MKSEQGKGMQGVSDLARAIMRHASRPGIFSTAVSRLSLIRADQPSEALPAVYEPSLCLIAQGSKRVALGEHSVVYDAFRYLLVSVDLPLVGHVLEASRDVPYLCCKIDLDRLALADVAAAHPSVQTERSPSVLAVSESEPDLIDAVYRLVRLLDNPRDIAALAPLIEREVLYRLLAGPHGGTLRQVAAADSHLSQVGRAIEVIRKGFDLPLRIDDIAASAGMSPSSLHAHFKAITRTTPMGFQRQLRLQEARRLMLAGNADAGSAGFAVGYGSPSQFSREYRRLFGTPPRRDIARLKASQGHAMAG